MPQEPVASATTAFVFAVLEWGKQKDAHALEIICGCVLRDKRTIGPFAAGGGVPRPATPRITRASFSLARMQVARACCRAAEGCERRQGHKQGPKEPPRWSPQRSDGEHNGRWGFAGLRPFAGACVTFTQCENTLTPVNPRCRSKWPPSLSSTRSRQRHNHTSRVPSALPSLPTLDSEQRPVLA